MTETMTLFDNEVDYRTAADLTLAAAKREIRIFDRDLERLELDARAHISLLSSFLAGGRDRHLRIVLHDTGPLERHQARLVTLIRQHTHTVEVRRTPEHLRHLTDSWILADQKYGTIRFHDDHARGKSIAGSAAEVRPWWQRFDEVWEASEVCSPGAATGL
ncbi:MAG TPA: hypothetical protein VFF82_06165 [Rhodocyclaceae bacterium]|nr:hypothetical protein [Rhodocyclaceae bacterium]